MNRPVDRNGECGSALVAVFVIAIVTSMSIASVLALISQDVRFTREHNNYKRAMAAAEAGLDTAILELRNTVIAVGAPTQSDLNTIQPPTVTGYEFVAPNGTSAFKVETDGSFRQSLPILEGRWKGLTGDSQRYVIRVGATDASGKGVVLTHSLQRLTIPVFQFGVFYENDLEILPGANMTLAGPVHTNKDLYLGAEANLYFENLVTSRGAIARHRKDTTTYQLGYVNIKDDSGVYRNMRNPAATPAFFEHTTPNWAVLAIQRWGGRLIDSDHKVPYLRLPIPLSEIPAAVKERAVVTGDPVMEAQRFENKAAIKIFRTAAGAISAVWQDGTAFPVTYKIGSTTYAIATSTSFGDLREGGGSSAKTVHSLDIHIANLKNHPNFPTTDGIVVYSYNEYQPTGTIPVVRLTNGTALPELGLTIASYNPIYIKGDYNTVGTAKPSLICGDSITVLSNNWNDTNSTNTTITKRTPTATTQKTVVMLGNTQTATGKYNGGVENVLRFLENWGSSVKFTFRGSLICLWDSRIATGAWQMGNVYSAPVRDYSYDPMYADPRNAPPGIPPVFGLEALTWAQSAWTATETR